MTLTLPGSRASVANPSRSSGIYCVYHPVTRKYASSVEQTGFLELHSDAMARITECRDSRPEQNWMNIQSDAVHQAGSQKRLRKLSTAHQADSFSQSAFETADELDSIFFHQLNARIVDECHRSREDIRAHDWLAMCLVLRPSSASAGLTARRNRNLVCLSTHEDRVHIFPVLGGHLLYILAEMQPVDRSVHARQESVETDRSAVGHSTHRSPPRIFPRTVLAQFAPFHDSGGVTAMGTLPDGGHICCVANLRDNGGMTHGPASKEAPPSRVAVGAQVVAIVLTGAAVIWGF